MKTFQAFVNIGIDGIVGKETWKTFESALAGTRVQPAGNVVTSAVDGKATWLKIANKEVGQMEFKGAEHNPRIIKYHATTTLGAKTDEVPWCSSFVNWVVEQAGLKGTRSAAAASWLKWGVSSSAKSGVIAVIRNAKAANSSLTYSGNHVEFLLQETSKHYVLLGGNQNNRVKISYYPKSSWTLRGYRWPTEN